MDSRITFVEAFRAEMTAGVVPRMKSLGAWFGPTDAPDIAGLLWFSPAVTLRNKTSKAVRAFMRAVASLKIVVPVVATIHLAISCVVEIR